jgi:hypothetical protein
MGNNKFIKNNKKGHNPSDPVVYNRGTINQILRFIRPLKFQRLIVQS